MDDRNREIGEAVEKELVRLVVMDGHDPDLVLGEAMSRIVTLITLRHGGDVMADTARIIADQCRGLPARAAPPLAAMPAQGRA